MPSRISAPLSQSSAPSTKSRGSMATRTHSIGGVMEDEQDTVLRKSICTVFSEAQRSINGQRKLIIRLRKIQESCCYEAEQGSRNKSFNEEFDEQDFSGEVTRCMLRVLPVKKSEPAGDRIIRFLGAFLKQAANHDNEIFQEQAAGNEGTVPETPSSRLTSAIISLLIPILTSKDKIVRFRATQIIAYLINTLDSIDEDLFYHIRLGLVKRLRDKESTVRVQAVYGLGRLASEAEQDDADDESEDDTSVGVLAKLLDILQNDPSADVRRALLLNLPFTPVTLPFLLERARDSDAGIRRALYSRLLPALGDFRHLSLTHREKLLRWGLRDRDENVKKATAKLFRERWIEDCTRPRGSNGEPLELPPGQISDPSLDGLLELLERIDVLNAGSDAGIALDAMSDFWNGRPDYCDFVTLDEPFWKDLTAESAFVARTFNDFCQSTINKNFHDKMPEVTRFAFLIQENVNKLVETVQKSALQEDAEEESVQQEFIVEQLLHIALTLDYSDEIGRRTMFSLMREALALAELPEEATKLVVEVLRNTCGDHVSGERELSRVVLEAIAEVHDNIMGDDPDSISSTVDNDGDDSFHSARSEISDKGVPKGKTLDPEAEDDRAVREIMVNMKCLHIAQCMLQNVECKLEQNPDIVTMLNNLMVPAVRSMEAPIRERGLLCLGLCCLLDINLAEENLALFLKCFSKGHEALQIIAIQIIGDILNAHPSLLTLRMSPKATIEGQEISQESPLRKDVHKLFSRSLKSPSTIVQSTACTALSKLMLSSPAYTSSGNESLLDHDELLRLLTIAYFDPDTAGNPALRQSLSYFLPVYCHSRYQNMERMGRITMSVLHWCYGIKEEMDVDLDGSSTTAMVGLNTIVSHLVDWTDGRRLAAALAGIEEDCRPEANSDVHLELAASLLDKTLGNCSKDERKLYMSMLGKVHISSNCDSERLQEVLGLINEAIEDKVASDATARNSLTKVQTMVNKAIGFQTSHAQTRIGAASDLDALEDNAVTSGGNEELHSLDDVTPMPSPRKVVENEQHPRPSGSEPHQSPADSIATKQDDETTFILGESEPSMLNVQLPVRTKEQQHPYSISDRPKWQVAELGQQGSANEIDDSTAREEMIAKMVDATTSPKRGLRPPRTSTLLPIQNNESTPAAKVQRQSVRASRRKQQSMISIAPDEESAVVEDIL